MDNFQTQPSNWRELWNALGNLGRALKKILRPTDDVLVDNPNRGYIVKDRTDGNYYRIYTDGGVLNTEVETDP